MVVNLDCYLHRIKMTWTTYLFALWCSFKRHLTEKRRVTLNVNITIPWTEFLDSENGYSKRVHQSLLLNGDTV